MNLKIFLVFTVLALAASIQSFSQANCPNVTGCLDNWGMNPAPGVTPVVGQQIGNPNPMPAFGIYAGNPTWGNGVIFMNQQTFGIQMTNNNNATVGVFTCYNFLPNTTYTVCLVANNTTTQQSGDLVLEAFNSTTNVSQIIRSGPYFNGGGIAPVQGATFTTNGNSYNQLRVYTSAGVNATNPYSVVIDDMQVTEHPVLVADQTNLDACQTTRLRATISGMQGVNVTWGPANMISGANQGNIVTAAPCNTQTYIASFTGQCQGGCTQNEQITVNVNPPNTNVVANPQNISICETSTLTATSTTNMNVVWDPHPTLTVTNPNQPHIATVRPNTTTVYTARFSCPGNPGCSYPQPVTVFVNPGTSVTATPPNITTCQSSTLTASSVGNMTVTWNPATGLSSPVGPVVTATPCSTTVYTATFTCAASGFQYTAPPVTVTVDTNGSIQNNSSSIPCEGPIDMSFVNNSGCAVSRYEWRDPQGQLASSASSFSQASSQRIDDGLWTLFVQYPNGCSETYTTSVNMTDCCETTADFVIESLGENPLRFKNLTTTNGQLDLGAQWFWDLGDGTTSTIRNPANVYNVMNDYTICLNVVSIDPADPQFTCCHRKCKDVHVPDAQDCKPKPAFDYTIVNPTAIDVLFTDKTAHTAQFYFDNVCSWDWDVSYNGSIVATATGQNPTVNLPPPPPGTPKPYIYDVCLTVTNCDANMVTTCSDYWCEKIIIP